MSYIETSYNKLPFRVLHPRVKRIRDAECIPNNTFTLDKVQNVRGKLEKRRYVKPPSIGNFDPRELEQQRNSSRGNEPHLDYDTENLYQESRTANQLEDLRNSPTSIKELNIKNSSIYKRRNK